MRHLLAFASIIPLLLATPALAEGESGADANASQNGTAGHVSAQDKHWLDYAATDNQGEIQESLVAEKKAHSLALKAFVRLMVDDHVQVESRLAALVNSLSVNVPDGPGQKDAKSISEMSKMHGEQFDCHFIQDQIEDHSDDIRKFSDEIKSTNNPTIRQFATQTVPILQQHLALAKAVQMSMAGSCRQNSGNNPT